MITVETFTKTYGERRAVDDLSFEQCAPPADSRHRESTKSLALDLCSQPAGFADGYQSLTANSVTIEVAAVEIPVASLADLVASKRAAGRPKDIVAQPALEARLRQSE